MASSRPDPDALVEQLHAVALFAKRRLLSIPEHAILKGSFVRQFPCGQRPLQSPQLTVVAPFASCRSCRFSGFAYA